MKKIIILMLVFTMMLTACAKPENEIIISSLPNKQENKPESSGKLEENVFGSVEELSDFLKNSKGLLEYVSENGKIALWIPDNLPEKYELSAIRISGGYITYYCVNSENVDDMFLLEWAFKASDGEELLKNSLGFGAEELKGKPGFYVEPIYSVETGEAKLKKLLWTEENECFVAYLSDEILDLVKHGTVPVKKILF